MTRAMRRSLLDTGAASVAIAVATLAFSGGAVADCETSFGKNMNALNVTCDKGWYKLEPFSGYSGVSGETSDGTKLPPAVTSVPQEQVKQMDEDALAILNKKAVLVGGEEGWKDIKVVEAIYKSANNGGKRVVI